MIRVELGLVCLVGACAVVACGDKAIEGSASGTAASTAAPATSGTAVSASPVATADASAGAEPSASAAANEDPLAALVDTDLSAFHKLWKGFSVKAPQGATIKQASYGPRIEKDEFKIELSYTHTSLDNTASNTRDCASYDQIRAVVERTKDLVVTSASDKDGKNKTYGFHMLVRPGGTLLGCTGGGPDLEKLKLLQQACASVTKS
jgi:hypothetical protein